MYNTSYIRIARLFPRWGQSFNFTKFCCKRVYRKWTSLVPDFFLHLSSIYPSPPSLFLFTKIPFTSVRQYRSTVAFLVHSTITSRSPVKGLSSESSAIVYPFLIEPKNSFLSRAFRTALEISSLHHIWASKMRRKYPLIFRSDLKIIVKWSFIISFRIRL